jgi:hypothetical protein
VKLSGKLFSIVEKCGNSEINYRKNVEIITNLSGKCDDRIPWIQI